MAYRSRYAATPPTARRRTSPWRIFLPTGVLLLLFAGLGGFWAYATWRVGQELDTLLAREAAHGRQWDCPNRTIAGFPFRIEVSCDRPTFNGSPGGVSTQGEVARFIAVAQIQSPNHVIMEVDGPLVATDASGRRRPPVRPARRPEERPDRTRRRRRLVQAQKEERLIGVARPGHPGCQATEKDASGGLPVRRCGGWARQRLRFRTSGRTGPAGRPPRRECRSDPGKE